MSIFPDGLFVCRAMFYTKKLAVTCSKTFFSAEFESNVRKSDRNDTIVSRTACLCRPFEFNGLRRYSSFQNVPLEISSTFKTQRDSLLMIGNRLIVNGRARDRSQSVQNNNTPHRSFESGPNNISYRTLPDCGARHRVTPNIVSPTVSVSCHVIEHI